jgi:hypothetical protein
VGRIKKVWPSGRLIAFYRPPQERLAAANAKSARSKVQNRFQSNNNLSKLLLQQPSLMQLCSYGWRF